MAEKKILIIQTAFLGDVVLATAVAEKLRRFFPQGSIHMLVRKGNESLLNEHPFLRVLVWDKKKGKLKNMFKLIGQIRKEKYDHVINLQRFASSGLMTVFSGAKETVGFDKNPLSFFFTRCVEHRIGSKQHSAPHEVERCLKTIEHFTDTTTASPQLYPTSFDREKVEAYCQKPFITISPASVWFTKQAPEKVWITFLSQLSGYSVYLLGAPNDRSMCERIAALSGNKHCTVLAGELSLLQSAALMSKAKMNYTNDSAPLHLCSAMQANVTALFCSTIPEFGFGPVHSNGKVVQYSKPLACRPCGLHGFKACPEKHFLCGNMEVEQLLQPLQP
jgi:ADP-heptose:LPS heptosyltransferase